MLLAVNIGNTNISEALFDGKTMIDNFSFPVKKYSRLKLKNAVKQYRISNCLISSVNPKITQVFKKDFKSFTGISPYIIGKDLAVPIKNFYRTPEKLGQDRLINAYAASKLYQLPAIIIDAGTAITFDLVSKKKEYLGGLILPGLEMSLSVLGQNTALLPKLKLSAPKRLIGNDTASSILAGVVFGAAALTKGLMDILKTKTGKNTILIGTGGDIALIKKYCRSKIKIDRHLTLKGINFIYHDVI